MIRSLFKHLLLRYSYIFIINKLYKSWLHRIDNMGLIMGGHNPAKNSPLVKLRCSI